MSRVQRRGLHTLWQQRATAFRAPARMGGWSGVSSWAEARRAAADDAGEVGGPSWTYAICIVTAQFRQLFRMEPRTGDAFTPVFVSRLSDVGSRGKGRT